MRVMLKLRQERHEPDVSAENHSALHLGKCYIGVMNKQEGYDRAIK